MSEKIIFLDRDGVINEYPGDGEYVLSKDTLRIIPGSDEAIRLLKDRGFKVFVISNQGCVSKGMISKEELISMTDHMLSLLDNKQARIDGVYYCIHKSSENCPYRKPNPDLLLKVLKEQQIDQNSLFPVPFFIGDSIKDVEAAKNAKLRSILVLSGREKTDNNPSWTLRPDYVFKNLFSAVQFIVSLSNN